MNQWSKLSFFLLAIFLITGCSSFKYKSIEDYRKDNEESRTETINKILEKYDLGRSNKKLYYSEKDQKNLNRYLNYILENDQYFLVLKKIVKETNFELFFDHSIQTLYYAFSKENFSHADKYWKESARDFLVYSTEFNYFVDEPKFRKFLSGYIDTTRYSDPFIFSFDWYSDTHPIKESIFDGSMRMNICAWDAVYTFDDFKKLSLRDQCELINQLANNYLGENGLSFFEFTLAEVITEQWRAKAEQLSRSPILAKLDGNTPMKVVIDKISCVTTVSLSKLKKQS